MDFAAARDAIIGERFAELPTSRCHLAADHSERFRLSVVRWEIDSSNQSRVVLDKTFLCSQRVEFYAMRLAQTLPLIEAAHEFGSLPKCSVNVNLADAPAARGIAFCSNNPDDILVPDVAFTSTLGYKVLREYYQANPIPWSDRLPAAFWRGGTSGRWRKGEDWRALPRLDLCRIAARRPDLFDVGITRVAQIPPEAEEEIKRAGMMRRFVTNRSFRFYQYQIDIDGNTNAWSSLFVKLLTGSPVMKVASPNGFRQWYYGRLIPWKNFVPVESDMSDLIEKVEWLMAHASQARQIGAAGRELVESMTFESEAKAVARRIGEAIERSATSTGPDRSESTSEGEARPRPGAGVPDTHGLMRPPFAEAVS